MEVVGVVAHVGKSLGGGLAELRRALARHGCDAPIWHEVKKSRQAADHLRESLASGAEVIFVWGGDGMVQRCVDAMAKAKGAHAALAIIPAGTANLLAAHLRVPADIDGAVRTGLCGKREAMDVGSVNGEHFAVMAGAGFDAEMIKRAGRRLKERFGRLAYLAAGAASLRTEPVNAVITADGEQFHDGKISCVIAGNVGKIIGGVTAFPRARSDDGILDLGVVTARSPAQWARVFCRVATGTAASSPLVKITRGAEFAVHFDRPVRYQLDGGTRHAATKLRVKVHPNAVVVCAPADNLRERQ